MALSAKVTEDSGMAIENQEKYINSFTGILTTAKASVEEFWLVLLNNDSTKNLISFLTNAIGLATTFIDKLGGLNLLIGAGIGAMLNKSGLSFFDTSKKGNSIVGVVGQFSEAKEASAAFATQLEIDRASLDGYYNTVDDGVSRQKYLTQNMGAASDECIRYAESNKSLTASSRDFALQQKATGEAINATTLKSRVATVALTALKTVMNIGINLAITALISLAAKGLEAIVNKTEILIQKGEDAKSAIEEISSAFSELKSSTEDMSKDFATLSQGVDQISGKNISLSTDDYQEFLDLSNQLAELFPSLNRVYDENGNAIVNLTGNVTDITTSLNEMLEAEKKISDFSIIENMPDAVAASITKLKQYEDELNTGEIYEVDLTAMVKEILAGGSVKYDPNSKFGTEVTSALYSSMSGQILEHNIDGETSMAFGTELTSEEQEAILEKTLEQQRLLNIEMARMNAEASVTKSEVASTINELQELMTIWLTSNSSYETLVSKYGDTLATAMQSSMSGINPWEDLGLETDIEIEDWISKNILDPLTAAEGDPRIINAFTKLFSGEDLSVDLAENYIDTLISYFESIGLEVPIFLTTRQEDIKSYSDRVSAQIESYVKKEKSQNPTVSTDRYQDKMSNFFIDQGINTESEYEEWFEITGLITDASDAMDAYIKAKKASYDVPVFSTSEFDGVLSSIRSLEDAYSEFKNEGFATSSTLNSLSETFGSVDGFEDFVSTVGNVNSSTEDMQKSFNDLASSYLSSIDGLNGLNASNAEYVQTQLEAVGVINAESVVMDYMSVTAEEYASIKQDLSDNSIDLSTATYEDIKAIVLEGEVTQSTSEYLSRYIVQKYLASAGTISTYDDVLNLENLCNGLAVSAELLTKVNALKEIYNTIELGDANVDKTYLQHQADLIMEQINGMVDYGAEQKFDFSFEPEVKTTEDKTDYWLEEYNKMREYWDNLHDSGAISEEEYLDALRDLNIKYFKDREKYVEEFHKYEQEWYEKTIAMYDTAISVVTDEIDRQIKELENGKEANELYWKSQIDNANIELELLKAANEARENAISLEKAQYELRRAENQRVNYVYKGGQFIYEPVDSDISDANAELEDIKYELRVSEIESRIKDLESSLDSANDSIDAQIKELEKLKESWSLISEEFANVQNQLLAEEILGMELEQVTNDQRLDTLNTFKDNYIAAQQAMADAAVLSANKILEANENLASGKSTSVSSVSSGVASSSSSIKKDKTQDKKLHGVKNSRGDIIAEFETLEEAKNYILKNSDHYRKATGMSISAYAKGGIISNSDSGDLDYIARLLGEDHIVATQNNEEIVSVSDKDTILSTVSDLKLAFNESQQKFIDMMSDISSNSDFAYENGLIKSTSKSNANAVTNDYSSSVVIQIQSVSLPNVDNLSSAVDLLNELAGMKEIKQSGYQYFNSK